MVAREVRTAPKNSTPLILLRIVTIFFLIGGIGTLCGTRLIMAINGGAFPRGWKEGAILLVVSACTGGAGIFFLRRERAL